MCKGVGGLILECKKLQFASQSLQWNIFPGFAPNTYCIVKRQKKERALFSLVEELPLTNTPTVTCNLIIE
mgnify:CR=1 FL=1